MTKEVEYVEDTWYRALYRKFFGHPYLYIDSKGFYVVAYRYNSGEMDVISRGVALPGQAMKVPYGCVVIYDCEEE